MIENNFDIKLNDHFKIYVLLKHKIIFETELQRNGIKYYCEINEQPFIEQGIRYFFLTSDMKKVDNIVVENNILTSVESLTFSDFRDYSEMMKILIITGAVLLGILILIATLNNFQTE